MKQRENIIKKAFSLQTQRNTAIIELEMLCDEYAITQEEIADYGQVILYAGLDRLQYQKTLHTTDVVSTLKIALNSKDIHGNIQELIKQLVTGQSSPQE